MVRFILAALVMAMGFACLPQVVQAGEGERKNFGEIYTECGIGGMLFQHQKWAGFAAVSNIFWDWGTTASSSAISSPDSCMGGQEEKMAAFIYHSYDSLENELAKGYGSHLDTLMTLAGQHETDSRAIESVRQDLARLVAQGDYSSKTRFQKAEDLYNIVHKNAAVAS